MHRREVRIVGYDAEGFRLHYRSERKAAAERGNARNESKPTQRQADREAEPNTGATHATFAPTRDNLAQLRELVRPLVFESLASAHAITSIGENLQAMRDRREILETDRLGGE